jgi:hypothetical protein
MSQSREAVMDFRGRLDRQDLLPHCHSKGQEMNPLRHIGQPLLITRQPSKPPHPADVPFDYPPPRQQHEAAFGLRQRDDLQGHAVIGTGIILIDGGDFDRLAGGILHRRYQLADLIAILRGGRRDVQRQQVPQRIDRQVDLPVRRFVPFHFARSPLSGARVGGHECRRSSRWAGASSARRCGSVARRKW